MVGRRRAVATLGLLLAGVLLTGCHMDGTVELISDDRVSIDVLVTGDAVICPVQRDDLRITLGGLNGVKGERTTTSSGADACHLTGTPLLSQLSLLREVTVTDVGEYQVLDVTFEPDHSDWPSGELTLRLPGDVQTSSQGTVAGNTVRLSGLSALDNHLKVVMLGRPGPPNSVVGLVAGTAGGVILTVACIGLARVFRHRRTAPAADSDAPVAEQQQERPSSTPVQPQELPDPTPVQSSSSPEPDPGSEREADTESSPPDPSVWAPP